MSINILNVAESMPYCKHLPKVFITGDLNVDNVVTGVSLGNICSVYPTPPVVGGSCFNAACALKGAGYFEPIVFGKTGKDIGGDLIVTKLNELKINHIIEREPVKPTGTCTILFFDKEEHPRTIFFSSPSANDYDCDSLRSALDKIHLSKTEYTFTSFHCIAQTGKDLERCRQFFATLRSVGCRMIVDIVPHTIYEDFQFNQIYDIIGGPVFILIAEYRTFMYLISSHWKSRTEPTIEDFNEISRHFDAKYYLIRYGVGNCSWEWVFRRTTSGAGFLPPRETGYQKLTDAEKPGFGDRLTAQSLRMIHEQESIGGVKWQAIS